jgi:hypothetical protein
MVDSWFHSWFDLYRGHDIMVACFLVDCIIPLDDHVLPSAFASSGFPASSQDSVCLFSWMIFPMSILPQDHLFFLCNNLEVDY